MITREVVVKVAELGRLALTEDEITVHAEQLNKILETMEVLQQIDTEGVEPLAHILPLSNVLRADEIGESLAKEQALANAPDAVDGMFCVPKIV